MNKHYLYENLMRDTKKHINESNFANTMAPEIYKFLFSNNVLKNVNKILKNDRILKKVFGYIIEEQIKNLIKKNISSKNVKYIDGKDNWWDFSINEAKIEIKAFQKGKLYSNVHVTANQIKNKGFLTFILVEYVVNNGAINITGIAFVNGTDIQFDLKYNRIAKNSNIKFYRREDYDFENDNI